MWRAGIGSSSSRSAPSPGGPLSPSMDHPQGRSSSEDDGSASSHMAPRPIKPIPQDGRYRRKDRGHRESGPNPRTIWSAAVSYRWSTDRPGQVASPVRMGPRLLKKKALGRSQGLSDKKARCFPTQQHQRLTVVTLGQKGAQSTFGWSTGPFPTVSTGYEHLRWILAKRLLGAVVGGMPVAGSGSGAGRGLVLPTQVPRAPCRAPSPTSGSPPPSRPPTTSGARSRARASRSTRAASSLRPSRARSPRWSAGLRAARGPLGGGRCARGHQARPSGAQRHGRGRHRGGALGPGRARALPGARRRGPRLVHGAGSPWG